MLTYFVNQIGAVKSTFENMLTSFINQIGAIDLGSIGTKFIWCNNKTTSDRIYQRIDRVIASSSWVSSFPKAAVINLPKFTSDHNPIILNSNGFKEPFKQRPFRFMHMWLRDMSRANSCFV